MTESIAVLNDKFEASQYLHAGINYFRRNQFALAIAAFDKVLALNPDEPYARWNRATALLSSGDYERGFVEHDWAWRLFHWRGFGPIGNDIDRITKLPLWKGERGVRLLAYHELGFGDAIMAMRYLPEMRRRAAITLVIDHSLVRLARSFGVDVVTDRVPEDLARFDYRLPFFSVMSALAQTATTIPAAPYVTGYQWSRGNRIGIAWSGRTQTSFSLAAFRARLKTRGFTLHALQPGTTGDDEVEGLRAGCDFTDVAERIAQMDHIVSVDTAAIHLAGAMGHPSAHLVLPYLSDWRWWHVERWYPQLKTYRQPTPDDWSVPFDQLNEVLHGR